MPSVLGKTNSRGRDADTSTALVCSRRLRYMVTTIVPGPRILWATVRYPPPSPCPCEACARVDSCG